MIMSIMAIALAVNINDIIRDVIRKIVLDSDGDVHILRHEWGYQWTESGNQSEHSDVYLCHIC